MDKDQRSSRFHHHFEIKTSNYNMITHCSRVDESFVDFLFESVKINNSDDSSGNGDVNYENLIDSLLSPSSHNKPRHFGANRSQFSNSGPVEPKVMEDNADG